MSSHQYPFQPVALPWPKNALEPFLSSDAITMHYDLIYRSYIQQMNSLAQNYPDLRSSSLEEMVDRYPSPFPISNVASQILNFEFFWRSLAAGRPSIVGPPALTEISRTIGPVTGGVPSGRLYRLIVEQYQSLENFIREFSQRALSHFGSGWIWLVWNPSSEMLQIVSGENAYNPIKDGYIPLLTLNVWEHAYLWDYGPDRKSYIDRFWNFVNWTQLEEIAADRIFGYRVRVGPSGFNTT